MWAKLYLINIINSIINILVNITNKTSGTYEYLMTIYLKYCKESQHWKYDEYDDG